MTYGQTLRKGALGHREAQDESLFATCGGIIETQEMARLVANSLHPSKAWFIARVHDITLQG